MKEPPLINIRRQEPQTVIATASMGEVLHSFQHLRASMLDLFQATGVDPTKTRELARELGVNRGLAWRLSRIARSTDGTDVAHDVPGRQSMERFVKICQDRGADITIADDVRDASDHYEQTVTACTGGRKTLAMLLANRHDPTGTQDRERSRRTLFEGACSVWGVQSQLRFVTVFLFPSPDDPELLDAAHITGYVGFRRLGSRPWPMSYEAVHDSDGKVQQIQKEPLDPTGYKEGDLQLMQEFCNPSDPKIDVRVQGEYKAFDLAAGPVGNEGMTTCVFGSLLKSIYEHHPEEPGTAGFMVMLQTPVERVLFDLFVHEDVVFDGDVNTHLLDRLTYPHQNRVADFDSQSMAISETARALPRTLAGCTTAHIPWYTKMLSTAAEKINIPAEKFAGTRFEMTYPPISTTLSRRVTLVPKDQ